MTLFDSGGPVSAILLPSNAGNAVRIGDGCATVSDYKLPTATVQAVRRRDGKAGVRFEVRSQDIKFDCTRPLVPFGAGNFSAKRRMRPACRSVFGRIR